MAYRKYKKSRKSSRSVLGKLASSLKMLNPVVQQRAAVKAQRSALRRNAMKYLRSNPEAAKQVLVAAGAPQDPMDTSDPTKVFGRGGYWGRMFGNWLGGLTGNSTIRSLSTSAFDSAGDYLADRIPGGNLLASGAEALYKAASGRGEYHLQDGSGSSLVPSFAGGTQDSIRIRSREYLGPVQGSAPLRIDQLLINPGDQVTFPKLSKLAMHYQQYIMNGCIFYYKTTSGISTNSADTAIGQVIMAMNYDSSEPAYTTKQDLMSAQYSNSGFPAQDIAHGIECAPFTNGSEVKRIRHGDSSDAKADSLNTDVGRFFLAVEGTNAAATRIGELWVTYDVTLLKSRDSRGAEVTSFRASGANAPAASLFTNLSTTYNTMGVTLNGNQIVFPKYIDPGVYRIEIQTIQGPPGAWNANANVLLSWPQVASSSGITLLYGPVEENGIACIGAPTSVPFYQSMSQYIRINSLQSGTAPSLTYSAGLMVNNATTVTNLSLIISRVPDDLA